MQGARRISRSKREEKGRKKDIDKQRGEREIGTRKRERDRERESEKQNERERETERQRERQIYRDRQTGRQMDIERETRESGRKISEESFERMIESKR
jgi:hypothetical protein